MKVLPLCLACPSDAGVLYIDTGGKVVVKCYYDAWGVPTIISDTSGIGITSINPFRYRCYYYDTETDGAVLVYYLGERIDYLYEKIKEWLFE